MRAKFNWLAKCAMTFMVIATFIGGLTACKEDPELEWTRERSNASIKGLFLTKDPDTIEFPVKVIFAVDFSLSMNDADPGFQRMVAVKNFVDEYNEYDNVSFNIILWSLTVKDQTRAEDGTRGFTKDPDELNRVLSVTENDTLTDYMGALNTIYTDIQDDINENIDNENLQRTKYMVIFLSDGLPKTGADAATEAERIEIIDRVGEIKDMTELSDVGGFSFHTFLLLGGFGNTDSADDEQELATKLLQDMAVAGEGRFTEFENAQAIEFISLVDIRLSVEYLLKYVIAYNRNVVPGTEFIHLDTDGDGLTDEQERDPDWNSNPYVRDSDNDGLSDYVEYSLQSPDKPFNPNTNLTDPDGDGPLEADTPDNTCIPGINGIWPDTDGDLLNDCEEDMIGTDRRLVDTDGDGIPDGIEFLAGTNVFSAEDVVDTDLDGVANPVEVREHTNVNSDDPDIQKYYAYDYQLTDLGKQQIQQGTGEDVLESVRRLFDINIDNINLLDVGVDSDTNQPYVIEEGEEVDFEVGVNNIEVFIAQVPADSPDDAPYFSKVTFSVNIDADENASQTNTMEFHSDELWPQSGDFSLPLNELN